MPTAVKFAAVGVIKGKIHVVGGATSAAWIANNQVYDPTADTWSTGASLPIGTGAAAAAVMGNVLYIFGGLTGTSNGSSETNAVWAYDPTSDTWSSKAAMPLARSSAGAVVDGDDGLIYVIGGYNGSRLATVEAYNPSTDSWTEKAPLLLGKSEPSVGRAGGTIIAANGLPNAGYVISDNEGYDISTNSWESLSADPVIRNTACAAMIGGKLYVAGGWNGSSAPNTNESFDLTNNTWSSLAPMLQAVAAPGSGVYRGHLYCFGGGDQGSPFSGTFFNSVQIYTR